METDYSKHTHFQWKIRWRLEHLGALGIMGEAALLRVVSFLLFFFSCSCWSYVGKTGGVQKLSLAPGCWYKGTVIHEIGTYLP